MHYQHPDHSHRNIKKAKTGGFQIQFVRNGKSHSDFSMNLDSAKLRRDAMEQELGLINQQFDEKPKTGKESTIPGTNQPMPAGLSMHYSQKRNQYHIQVFWTDTTGKQRNKQFYAGTENTYPSKADQAYERAVEFRESWEDAMLCDRLNDFDHKEFNL